MITKSYLKIALLLISLVIWGSSSPALAQTEPEEILEPVEILEPAPIAVRESTSNNKLWFGTSASLHYIVPTLDFHLGVKDLLGKNNDFRTTLSIFSFDNGGLVAGGINSIMNLDNNDLNVNNYMGFGPRILHVYSTSYLADSYEPYTTGFTYFAVGGLWGSEYNAQGTIRPYYELNASLPIFVDGQLLQAFVPVLSISTGFNFYF